MDETIKNGFKILYNTAFNDITLRISNIYILDINDPEQDYNQSSIEDLAIDVLRKTGTIAIKTSEVSKNLQWTQRFPFIKEVVKKDYTGRPDLVAYDLYPKCEDNCDNCKKFSNFRFIEVKSMSDGLRVAQLVWLANHGSYPLEILLLEIGRNQTNLNPELKKPELNHNRRTP